MEVASGTIEPECKEETYGSISPPLFFIIVNLPTLAAVTICCSIDLLMLDDSFWYCQLQWSIEASRSHTSEEKRDLAEDHGYYSAFASGVWDDG